MSNRRNIQFMYSPHNKSTVLDCSFIVDSTNGNGYGVRSLKGSGRIQSLYMNTSASFVGTLNSTVNVTGIASGTSNLKVGMSVSGTNIPSGTTIASIVSSSAITLSQAATGSGTPTINYAAIGQPTTTGPAAGYIIVNLQDNYNTYLGGYSGFAAPISGTPLTSGLTVGNPYIIVSLGSSTLAQWQAAGLSAGITPAVGASFIAIATSIAGGGAVEAPGTGGSGIDHIEVIGDPNVMNSNLPMGLGFPLGGLNGGMQLILACYKNGTITAPNNNTTIGMNFYMNDSAQGV